MSKWAVHFSTAHPLFLFLTTKHIYNPSKFPFEKGDLDWEVGLGLGSGEGWGKKLGLSLGAALIYYIRLTYYIYRYRLALA